MLILKILLNKKENMSTIKIILILVIAGIGSFMIFKNYKKGYTTPPVLSGITFVLSAVLFFLSI